MVSEQIRDKRLVLVLDKLIDLDEDRFALIARASAFDGKSQYQISGHGDFNVDFTRINADLSTVFTRRVVCLKYFSTEAQDRFILKNPENKFGLYKGHVVNEFYAKRLTL